MKVLVSMEDRNYFFLTEFFYSVKPASVGEPSASNVGALRLSNAGGPRMPRIGGPRTSNVRDPRASKVRESRAGTSVGTRTSTYSAPVVKILKLARMRAFPYFNAFNKRFMPNGPAVNSMKLAVVLNETHESHCEPQICFLSRHPSPRVDEPNLLLLRLFSPLLSLSHPPRARE